MVEQSLMIPDICSLNLVIYKYYFEYCFLPTVFAKTKINNNEAGNGPFKKVIHAFFRFNISFVFVDYKSLLSPSLSAISI